MKMHNIAKHNSTIFFLCIFMPLLLCSEAMAFTVSSPFGWRIHPIKKRLMFHTGVDIPIKYGTPIVAIFDGTVVFSGPRNGYGNTVILKHIGNKYTLYAHCSCLFVRRGQRVKAEEIIALSGNSGLSIGPHLHLEYWVNGRYVDPMEIWQKNKRPLLELPFPNCRKMSSGEIVKAGA